MRTLDRYLLHNFLVNYLLALAVLISLYVVLDLFVNLDEFTENNATIATVAFNAADYYFYNLPLYFSQLSGVITAFAACGTLARLQRQNELTALLSSGISLHRIAAPIIAAGLLTNTLLVLDYELILPSVGAKLARNRDDVTGSRAYQVWFVKDGSHRLVSAQKFSPAEAAIRDMIVLETAEDASQGNRLQSIIRADKAHWDGPRRGWALTNGRRLTALEGSGGLYGHHALNKEFVDFYPCSLSPQDLQLRQSAAWLGFLSTGELNMLARRGDVDTGRISQIKHSRFTMPLGNMILLMLGLYFFLHRSPMSTLTQGAKALASCSLLFMLTLMAQQMIGAVGIHPALPAWLPILVFTPVIVLMYDNIKT